MVIKEKFTIVYLTIFENHYSLSTNFFSYYLNGILLFLHFKRSILESSKDSNNILFYGDKRKLHVERSESEGIKSIFFCSAEFQLNFAL